MKWLRQNKFITLLALVKFILPFVTVDPVWELHRDEYLYYQQGQHLSFGFLENPPLLAFLGYISSVAGGTVSAIKFWPALVGALTLLVTTSIVRELGGKLFAQVIAALGILLSGYMRIHYLFQPNILDIFYWTLSVYYFLRYVNTRQDKFLYFLSIALVLGCYSKYSVLFFMAAMAISILATKYRSIFTRKAFLKAVTVGLLLIIPNLLWQYFHKFPLIHHIKELRETQLQYLNKTDFLKDQLLMLFPVLFVWLAGLLWLLKNNNYRVIALIYFTVLILLMAASGKSYYTLGAYPMLLAAGGVWLERASVNKRWLMMIIVTVILLLSLPFIPLMLPMQTPETMVKFNQKYIVRQLGLLKWEDLHEHDLQQDFADMLGWKELTEKTENFYHSLPAIKRGDCLIYCRQYGQAAALKYYGNDAVFRSKIFCDNGTFLLWIPPELTFTDLIFVGRKLPAADDEVFNHFKKVSIVDSVTNPLSRQYGDKIIFFQDADTIAVKLARAGLSEMRAEYERGSSP